MNLLVVYTIDSRYIELIKSILNLVDVLVVYFSTPSVQ